MKKLAHNAVQPSSETFHRLLFEQAGMAMVAADLEGKILGWNHAARRMFGAGVSEMLGTDWSHLIPGEEREQSRVLLASTLGAGRVGEFEFSLRDEQGESRRLAAIVTPIVDPTGERIGGLACVRDITNRMVLQDQLAQQSKMASLGELAGALSHHFNNILGGVITSVDFALASRDPEVITRVMEKTAAALSRASGLVRNLLAFAEGDHRDASLCELAEVIVDLVAKLEPRLREAEIRLEADLDSIPIVEVPRSAVHTVVSNLVDNAIEAMPHGGTLSISVVNLEREVEIRIGDTGCGLDEGILTRIFEPFYSTKSGGQKRNLGRGLGLAVAHGVLKVLQGSVHVSSTLGEGTVFTVRLPRPDPPSP